MLNNNATLFPILTTERLILRRLLVDDEQEIFSLRSDIEINKYLDRPPCQSIEDARIFINKVNENIDKNNSLYWSITLNGKNTLIGTICLYGFSDDKCFCEIGYELLKNYQRQGIMKEAVEKVIDHAFNTIKVHNIQASIHKDNHRSINLLEKFSFSYSNGLDETDMINYHLTTNAKDIIE